MANFKDGLTYAKYVNKMIQRGYFTGHESGCQGGRVTTLNKSSLGPKSHHCPHCGQHITPAAWCIAHIGGTYSLWTANEAAASCGCSPVAMGLIMRKLFAVRHIRLGRDICNGKKCAVYCVWPEPYNRFFTNQPTSQIRKLWRDQHERRSAHHLF